MKNKILIVDDEIDIVSMLDDYFTINGYDVLIATNGLQAIFLIQKQPNLILLDVNMPDIDGLELCSRIRKFVNCPILFLSARIEDSEKIKGFLVGGDDYIVKPFSLEELGARVAVPLEMLLSTIGIVILTPIFLPEQRKDIEDVIRSKYIDVFYIYLIRIVCSVFSIIVFVLAASLFLYLNNCQINTKIIFGVIADCIFLGSIGLFIFALTNNFVTSLMFTSIYYFINLILQKKIKMFNLFSMMENDYSPNIYLFITGILLIIFSIIIKRWLLNNR